MAISTPLATLRRSLAQRMNFWGGDLSNNGPGFFSAIGTTNTAIDTARPEPDDEWDESWIVLNPGSTDQTNAPTVWRRVAIDAGWVVATGTFTIQGTWPAPYNVVGPGFASGTSTSVNATTMTDNTATWTTNQWKGHTVTMGAADAIILSNTSTVLTLTTIAWLPAATPTNGPYTITLPYEVFKVFRPENWLQAINWAITRAYPKRHISVTFEVPQSYFGRIIKWGDLVRNLKLSNPTTAPTVTEIANGQGQYQPGVYTFGYTFYNNLGETLASPTTTVTIAGTFSSVQFAAFTGVPAAADGVRYYSSIQPGDSTLGLLEIGNATQPSSVTSGSFVGENKNGTVDIVQFTQPFTGDNAFVPIYNTTNVDVQELHHLLRRVNPGQYPEIWNDLGSDLYKPLGGKTIMLMYLPLNYNSIRFICTGITPSLVIETDVTDEPAEMLYAGGEHYLWELLVKTSTIVNVNWKDLSKAAMDNYNDLKDNYALDTPRTIAYRPVIRTQYAFLPWLPFLYPILEKLIEHKNLFGL